MEEDEAQCPPRTPEHITMALHFPGPAQGSWVAGEEKRGPAPPDGGKSISWKNHCQGLDCGGGTVRAKSIHRISGRKALGPIPASVGTDVWQPGVAQRRWALNSLPDCPH